MKICSECGMSFKPTNNRQLACNKICSRKREIRIKRERRQNDPNLQKRCRETVQRYRDKNRELVRQRDREKYWLDPDKFRKKSNNYNKQHRQEKAKYSREWRAINREHCRQYYQERHAANPEPRRKYQRNRYRQNLNVRKASKEYNKQWRKENPHKIAAYNQSKRTNRFMDPQIVQDIFARDNYTCVYCNSKKDLSLDHIVPVSKGGSNDYNNLCTACKTCNCSKGAKSVEEFKQYLIELK